MGYYIRGPYFWKLPYDQEHLKQLRREEREGCWVSGFASSWVAVYGLWVGEVSLALRFERILGDDGDDSFEAGCSRFLVQKRMGCLSGRLHLRNQSFLIATGFGGVSGSAKHRDMLGQSLQACNSLNCRVSGQ